MFAVLKRTLGTTPRVHPVGSGEHVYMTRDAWLAAKAVRSCSAAPPFSTTSPSGRSEADGGVPLWLLAQKVLVADQKLFALGEMKPVAGLTAALSTESARKSAPLESWS